MDHYKRYEPSGQPQNGIFADIFEEEYRDIVENLQPELGDDDYIQYLNSIPAEKTHAGYFSIDKKGRMTNSKLNNKKEKTSDDIDAYDLITNQYIDRKGALTGKTIVQILTGIEKPVFDQFKTNPEEFIIKAAGLINDEKGTAIIQHITYDVMDDHYDTDIFTEPTIKGRLGTNAMKANKHLYDHIVYDSTKEHDFAEKLDVSSAVAVYVKLPKDFYISTPVGHYNPDWAIAFYEGTVKHIYFVAETKGSMNSTQLRNIEESKIHCAQEHFKAISGDNVVCGVVDSYEALLDKVMK